MTDIFDNKILCRNCSLEMKPLEITKNGFVLRAIECKKCSSRVIHPKDEQDFSDFMNLRKKEFNVCFSQGYFLNPDIRPQSCYA